jgi:hypothetical protein
MCQDSLSGGGSAQAHPASTQEPGAALQHCTLACNGRQDAPPLTNHPSAQKAVSGPAIPRACCRQQATTWSHSPSSGSYTTFWRPHKSLQTSLLHGSTSRTPACAEHAYIGQTVHLLCPCHAPTECTYCLSIIQYCHIVHDAPTCTTVPQYQPVSSRVAAHFANVANPTPSLAGPCSLTSAPPC